MRAAATAAGIGLAWCPSACLTDWQGSARDTIGTASRHCVIFWVMTHCTPLLQAGASSVAQPQLLDGEGVDGRRRADAEQGFDRAPEHRRLLRSQAPPC